MRDKIIADAEMVARAAIVAGLAALVVPNDVFDLHGDWDALYVAGGIAVRAALHKLGSILSKA